MSYRNIFLFTLFLFFIAIFLGCIKENSAARTDKELYDMARSAGGFTWYKNSDAILNKSSGTGHPQAFLRTRYNAIASANLDSAGKLKTGATFQEGALIVKELYDNATSLGRYAMLLKRSGSPDADAKGWVWGYVNADGSIAAPASDKGSACIGCHSQSGNTDYMLMGKYFP